MKRIAGKKTLDIQKTFKEGENERVHINETSNRKYEETQTVLKKNISDTSNYQLLVFGYIEMPNFMDQIMPKQIIVYENSRKW